MRLSFSKLNDFETCARLFYYKHVQRLPTPDSEHIVVGYVYHSAIAFVLRHGLKELDQELTTLFVGQYKKDLDKFSNKLNPVVLKAEVLANVTRLQEQVLVHVQPRLIEDYFKDPKTDFAGVTDLLSETALVFDAYGKIVGSSPGPAVYDWKTKNSLRNRRTDEDARNSPQLALYALRHEAKVAGFVEIPRILSAPIRVLQVEYSEEDLRRWRLFHADRLACVRSLGAVKEHYPMTERSNGLCSKMFCAFWDKCYGKTDAVP